MIGIEVPDCIKQDELFSFGPMHTLRVSLDLFGFVLKEYNTFIKKEVREGLPISGRLYSLIEYKFFIISMEMIAKDDAKPDK